MSSREEQVKELTTKEKVVSIAKQDPFLKVKEIANLANTTSHYVRTILSEAKLSLAQLRKEYAEANIQELQNKNLLIDLLDFSSLNLTFSYQLEGTLLNDSICYHRFSQEDNSLLKMTQVFTIADEPELISTYFVGAVEATTISQIRDDFNLNFSALKIKAITPPQEIADRLEQEPNSFVLVLERKIFIDWELKGLEVIYCNPAKINLVVDNGKVKVISAEDE